MSATTVYNDLVEGVGVGKRYSHNQAMRLLVRLLVLTEGKFSEIRARRVLGDVLGASLSDFVVYQPAGRLSEGVVGTEELSALVRLARDVVLLATNPRANPPGVGLHIALKTIKLRNLPVTDIESFLEIEGSLEELVILQMVSLMRRIDRNRLRRCECTKLFVRIGRREFCSDRCQKRVYMRRYRAEARQ